MTTAAKWGLALLALAVASYAFTAYLVVNTLLDPPSPFSWPHTIAGAALLFAVTRVRGFWRSLAAVVGVLVLVAILTTATSSSQVQYGFAAAGAVLLADFAVSVLRGAARRARELADLPDPAELDELDDLDADEPIIVGLTGYAGSGKDTAARGLLWTGEWTHASFAAKLKEFAYRQGKHIYIAVHRGQPGYEAFNITDAPVVHVLYSEYVDEVGLEVAKQNDQVRKLLQATGTDAGREVLGDNVWVDAAMDDLPLGNVVFTDVRFPNEAAAIHDAGGYLIRVVRPGNAPVNAHSSETALDDCPVDAVVVNDGTQQQLHQRLKNAIARLELAHARTA